MDYKELISYIQTGATNTSFFVSKIRHENEIGPILSAMANSSGGKIFIGVDLNNCHLIHVDFQSDWLNAMIDQSCSPYINVLVDSLERNEQTIYCITVPEGEEKPYHFKNKVFIMEDSNCRLATYDEVESYKSTPNMKLSVGVEEPVQKAKSMLDMAAESLSRIPNASESSSETNSEVLEDQFQKDLSTITDELISINVEEDTNHIGTIQEPVQIETIESNGSNDSNKSIPNDQNNTASDLDRSSLDTTSLFSQSQVNSVASHSSPGIAVDTSLNERQEKCVRFLRERSGFIKNKLYRRMYDVSHKTAHLELVGLVEKGILKQEGLGRSTCYVLAA